MERCPNCGQLGRIGAKFCTICGHRLAAEESNIGTAAVVEHPDAEVDNHRADARPDDAVAIAGWPADPVTEPPDTAWAPSAANTRTQDDAASEDQDAETLPEIWATSAPSAWPAPPASGAASTEAEAEPAASVETSEATGDSSPEAGGDDGAEGISNGEPEDQSSVESWQEPESAFSPVATTPAEAEIENARARAIDLLDELRGAVAAISGNEPPDLSGVISDLEVAVTPPGAIAPEALAELREALLSARERPRDIDTVVDLTGRIDAMVALIIAYDRTIAAIERSLETLRRP